MGWRTGFRVLPYRMQDDYSRDRAPVELLSVVMENEHLRVRVLPEVGGKVTEILHRPTGKQLIAKNSVFQPANIALRNAWTHGGIEWNTPHLGHHCLTMEPLHTARIHSIKGEPALRLYAWERMKCFPYQIDLHLPGDSTFLFAHIRIINPNQAAIPMYWWTNIGIEENAGRRVIVPADTAFKFTKCLEVPILDGVDHTYPTRVDHTYDLYFRIPPKDRKWLAAVDRDGTGLLHVSTPRLLGRKMFTWGSGPGGKRWQEYLNGPGERFFEVQAGLARTQYHSLPMPAGAVWSWTEAFGHLHVDPAKAHGGWSEATAVVAEALESRLSSHELDQLDAGFADVARDEPQEILYHGLGWGALEIERADACQEDSGIPLELPFPSEDLGPEHHPWLELLNAGALPLRDPSEEPGSYMIQKEWRKLLEASITIGRGDHWLSWLHLGVMHMEAGDADAAQSAWKESICRTPNLWACRNLACLELRRDNTELALRHFLEAWKLGPKITPLALEILPVMEQLDAWPQLKDFLATLDETTTQHERVRLAQAKLALHENDLETLESLLDHEYETISEGETTLTDLWFAMHERRLAQQEGIAIDESLRARVRREFPPPAHIDFRMFTKEKDAYIAPQESVG